MGQITRQMKRKLIRDLGKQQWQVQDWQPMKFERQENDIAGISDTIEIYTNNMYQCIVREHKEYTHLSIKRHDKAQIHSWQHLQQIKNDICGEEREGVELYPAMRRIVDTCNQYHLWVFRGYINELGFKCRAVIQNQITLEEDFL